jgi:hypothetical protein
MQNKNEDLSIDAKIAGILPLGIEEHSLTHSFDRGYYAMYYEEDEGLLLLF